MGERFDPKSLRCLMPCPDRTVRSDDLSACVACPDGFEAVASGIQGICAPCKPGSFHSNATGLCTQCPPGQFQHLLAQTACVECSPGNFSAKSGSSECSPCSLGRKQPSPGRAECLRC